MIEFGLETIPVTRQCDLLDMARSTFYYRPKGLREEDIEFMRLIDEKYTKSPFYGYRKMTHWLWLQGYHVNKKRVLRLMQKMGLQAIYPKPKLSKPGKDHLIYPYLLRNMRINQPEIFNSDQGAQFTSSDFQSELKRNEIRISMDGRGRVLDNIFVERLWRTLKYEEVYLKDYETVYEAIDGIRSYFKFYNEERLHQALDYKTPAQIYKHSSSERRLIA